VIQVAKLRWLLGKATAELGEVRLAELSPEHVCAWRLTVPEGHRFEATQALRQVLNRAVTWKLIDDNPAKRVPNPGRRCREQRPFELGSSSGRSPSGSGRTSARWSCSRPRPGFDPRSCSRSNGVTSTVPPHPTGVCERAGQADQDAAEQTCGSAAGDRTRGARPATAARRQPAALPERARRPPRLPQLQPPPLEARPENGRDRAAARPLRPAPHLRHLRAPRRRPGVRPLTVHGHEHRDDRPPLRPPRGRQLPARRLAPRRARARTGRGRWVDAGQPRRRAAPRHGFQVSRKMLPAGGGRSVDVEVRNRRRQSDQKGLISRSF